MTELAAALAGPGQGDAVIGQVDVVEFEVSNGAGAGSVVGGQGDDDPAGRVGGQRLEGMDLVVGQWQQDTVAGVGGEPDGGVGEDQGAFLGEPEQQAKGAGGVDALGGPTAAPARQQCRSG